MRTTAVPPSSQARRTAAGAVLLGLAIALLPAGTAHAHVELRSSDPAEGAVLAAAPSAVRLEMSGDVTFGSVVATDGCGRQVESEVTVDGRLVDAVLADVPVAPGAWEVVYELIAVDGHLVAGEVRFTVAGDVDCEPVAEPDAEAGADADADADPEAAADSDGPVVPADADTDADTAADSDEDPRAVPVGSAQVQTVSTTSEAASAADPAWLAPGPAVAVLVVVLSGVAVLGHRLHLRRRGGGADA